VHSSFGRGSSSGDGERAGFRWGAGVGFAGVGEYVGLAVTGRCGGGHGLGVVVGGLRWGGVRWGGLGSAARMRERMNWCRFLVMRDSVGSVGGGRCGGSSRVWSG